jgi:hypothetical protein
MLRRPGAAHAVRFLALVGVAALVAACGSTVATAPPTSGSLSPSATSSATSSAAPSAAPSASASTGSSEPSVEPNPSTLPQGSEGPSPSAGSSPQPGSSDACSGTAENRDFYAALAASVAWDVYCPVLPAGWFVASGSYRLSGGGQLTITYRGPGGAEIDVREGGYCAGQPDCIPTGTDAGSASFGDLPARLLALGNGSWMVVVAPPGGDAAWQVTGTGMDGPALAAYTAAFAHVVQ